VYGEKVAGKTAVKNLEGGEVKGRELHIKEGG